MIINLLLGTAYVYNNEIPIIMFFYDFWMPHNFNKIFFNIINIYIFINNWCLIANKYLHNYIFRKKKKF